MRMIWFLRMARWAHRPPSAGQVTFVLGIVAAALLLLGVETFLGWPDWLTPDGGRRGRITSP